MEVLPEGKIVRPLVLIQFPNGQPETIKAVETKLESMGYTYDNGMVSIWMSEDKKDLTDNLTDNDGIPAFLLMKQAISTGWDCPRAKILVKLREGMSEQFGKYRPLGVFAVCRRQDIMMMICLISAMSIHLMKHIKLDCFPAWIRRTKPVGCFLKDKVQNIYTNKAIARSRCKWTW